MENIIYIIYLVVWYLISATGKLPFNEAVLSMLFITGIYLACKLK